MEKKTDQEIQESELGARWRGFVNKVLEMAMEGEAQAVYIYIGYEDMDERGRPKDQSFIASYGRDLDVMRVYFDALDKIMIMTKKNQEMMKVYTRIEGKGETPDELS